MVEFLDPGRKLAEATAGWLCGRVERDPSGARSLAHAMVVVPTAQSGRNLRLALAAKAAENGWGGILPPRVVLPFQLVVPADRSLPDADEAETAAMFMCFLSEKRNSALAVWPHLFRRAEGTADLQAVLDPEAGFALLDQMSDIWRILSGKGLLMRDVPADAAAARVLEAALGDDKARWDELASFETEFFAFLAAHGLRLPAASVALAKKAAAPLDPEIREIVLPALADPVLVLHDVLAQYEDRVRIVTLLHCRESMRDRFDRWGCPRTERWTGAERPDVSGLEDGDIASLPDGRMLAERLVEDFPARDSGLKPPVLGLCDPGLFTAISAAFLNEGYAMQNPGRNRLAVSSLGVVVRDLLAFWRPPAAGLPWKPLASLLRADDVLAALLSEGLASSRSRVLDGLDIYQNACLPATVEGRLAPPRDGLRGRDREAVAEFVACGDGLLSWMEEARKDRPLAGFLRAMLERIFSGKSLGAARPDKEFAQAADCVRKALAMLSGGRICALGLPDSGWIALARRILGAAAYSLESTEKDAVRTEGWLELVWSLGDEIALAGLHEGSVPDSVVGHAFLPDGLRKALGLTSNETRLARDSWLLHELVGSHSPRSVRAYVSRTDAKGDICRPSRLLFLCSGEALASRVECLFGDAGEPAPTPPRAVSAAWIPRLPDEAPLPRMDDGREYISASAIDTYLKSPLVYLLKYGLGMGNRYREKEELGFDDYGTAVHRILQRFADGQKARPLADEASIARSLEAETCAEAGRFGAHPTVNILLQLQSVRERLLRFAAVQAAWAQDGWRVEGTEIPFFAKPFAGMDVWVKGFVDRVDCRALPGGGREFRVIDYKTWDDAGDVAKHIYSKSDGQIAFADRLKLPAKPVSEKKNGEPGKPVRMLSVQLPLYGACLEAQFPERFDGPFAEYVYLVLAEDQAKAVPVEKYADLSMETARVAIERIKAGVFWPPRAGENMPLYDFGRLFSVSPERDFGEGGGACGWLAKQEAKLEELGNA